MLKSIVQYRDYLSYQLQPANSIYFVHNSYYEKYDRLAETYKSLTSLAPLSILNTPYLIELGRDLFFKLTISTNNLLEDNTQKMIYIVREQLNRVISNNPKFLKINELINHDATTAYIFCQMLVQNLWQWHSSIEDAVFYNEKILQHNGHHNVDYRDLFSEQFADIQPYPKKLVSRQQKLAKTYMKEHQKNPEIIEQVIHNAYKKTTDFLGIFNSSSIGGILFES